MLHLDIYSFSYHKTQRHELGLKHGGGYEFDCRCLPNPGREERFKQATGRNPEVIKLLEKDIRVPKFLANACSLIRMSVEDYIDRKFDYLAVGFGCTGGQHRSVYCAEKCFSLFNESQGVKATVTHRQFETFDWLEADKCEQ